MANRKRAEARRKAAARTDGGGSKKLWMWAAIVAVVAVAVVGILIASNGSDAQTPGSASDGSTLDTSQSALPVSQPVKVAGDPLPQLPDKGTDTAIGKTAPVLDGLNFSDQPIKVDSSKGAYMLVFLAHWCPHCNAKVPRLLDWKHSGQVPADLNVIGVATAVSPSSPNYPPATWFSNKGWEWPVLVDESQGDRNGGKAAAAFGANGWPYFVIVGKDGKVKIRVSGEVAIPDLQKIVDKALAG